VKNEFDINKVFAKSALIGAAGAAFCGLLLWGTPLGRPWVNSSYDFLFRFGVHSVTNRLVLVLMDEDSYELLGQSRDTVWDRALHARLLNKLADDQSSLVVFDVFFKSPKDPGADRALADAMRRHGHVVLMADVTGPSHPGIEVADVITPQAAFLEAGGNAFGVGHADAQTGQTARRHWPFYSPGEGNIHSLPWAAAERLGAQFDRTAEQQWLRYYGENGAWETISYRLALSTAPGFFHGKVVFIGNTPKKTDPGLSEPDKFLTPYGNAVGGMEIMATTFLNLINGDWLRRPPAWVEAILLAITGVLIGGGLCQFRPLAAGLAAAAICLTVTLAFVSWSYFSNYWFPWLVIAGGQVPCALAWAWVSRPRQSAVLIERFPGYATVGEPFGKGSYGKVWLARDATGQFRALKEIELSKFENKDAYEREFRGIKSYKPVSDQHLGLLHIDHVNRNDEQGYFYYVMELGDPLDPDWEQKGGRYLPRDLARLCSLSGGNRLSAPECIRIGIALLEPLDFLHQRGLVHRDIKPSNIVFVNDRPKLADVGLVRKTSKDSTWVGTEFYMPPVSEPPGTVSADIYAMGKVLYVSSTGKSPDSFAELSTSLVAKPEFMRLNQIICKACQPSAAERYPSAADMLAALREAQTQLDAGPTRRM
jgi:CHASE2 domain-containing sensor protein